jgi:hypothetical protein
MPRQCSLVTAVPLYHAPSAPGLLSWSEDNVIAIGTDKHITLLHAGSLKLGRMTVDLPWPSGETSPDTERLGSEGSAAAVLAAKQNILRRFRTFHPTLPTLDLI